MWRMLGRLGFSYVPYEKPTLPKILALLAFLPLIELVSKHAICQPVETAFVSAHRFCTGKTRMSLILLILFLIIQIYS